MRILLVAPDQPDINARPEVRDLSERHETTVWSGPVRLRELFDLCARRQFDILHFAGHIGYTDDEIPRYLVLSSGDALTPEDLVQLAQLAAMRLLFLNACYSGVFAHLAVRSGVPAAIHLNIPLKDTEAWKVPAVFYEYLHRQEQAIAGPMDFRETFYQASPPNGWYGWASDGEYGRYLMKPVLDDLRQVKADLAAIRQAHEDLVRQRSEDMDRLAATIQRLDQAGTHGTAQTIVQLRRQDWLAAGITGGGLALLSIVPDILFWLQLRG